MYKGYYESPIGLLEIVADEQGIQGLWFTEKQDKTAENSPLIEQCMTELAEYFQGKRRIFTVPIHIEGTPFQKEVWRELCNIPYGRTVTYKEIAMKLGNPNASRAVGGANNKNLISIIIPCHRVIGANKKLVGYAGGLDKKEWLLHHEENFR